MIRTLKFVSLGLSLLVVLSGCSPLMGNLRRDLDDTEYGGGGPTVGGRWTERSVLGDEAGDAGNGRPIGHQDRSLASAGNAEGNEMAMGDEVNSESAPHVAPPVKRQYKNGTRATKADFLDESQNEGSLWASDGQTNYYFTKNKIRGVGDIVSVVIDSDLIRDVGIEVRKTLNGREKDFELALAQQRILEKTTAPGADAVNTAAAAPARTPASGGKADDKGPAVPQATMADVDVTKSLSIKANDVFMAEILERYPNGNYKIRATKRIPYKNGSPRMISMLAVVKGTDIGEDDTVASGKLYEYRIEATR